MQKQYVFQSTIVCVCQTKKKQFIMTFFTFIYKTYIDSHLDSKKNKEWADKSGSFLLRLRVHAKFAIIEFEQNLS